MCSPNECLPSVFRQPARIGQGVDRVGDFVAPDGFDPPETQRPAARVPLARVDRIESDFQHDVLDAIGALGLE